STDAGDAAVVGHLQAVVRARIVSHAGHIQALLAVFHEFGEGCVGHGNRKAGVRCNSTRPSAASGFYDSAAGSAQLSLAVCRRLNKRGFRSLWGAVKIP